MEKSALIFIGILLFSTCVSILARTGYQPCKKNSDCARLKCPSPLGHPTCVKGGCECPFEEHTVLPADDTNCGVAACFDYCKAKGEVSYACHLNQCYCRKPPM
ncbi:PREDICTED: putative defensin-like protein 307 [Brassica oleracea var. oleracea]|uniref:putative defensin-like protein 307 n=1 Tax=Brassica oleracea var. oleracea TaxID=109376 RepID=UPI0006A6B1BB|nr:PREDICTED: putative defensin-like protein 307 [Brassica oleracea var. oleracea]